MKTLLRKLFGNRNKIATEYELEYENTITIADDVKINYTGNIIRLYSEKMEEKDMKKKYKKIHTTEVITDNVVYARNILVSTDSQTTYIEKSRKIDFDNEIEVNEELDIDKNILKALKNTCYEKDVYTPLELGCIKELYQKKPNKRVFNENLEFVLSKQKMMSEIIFNFQIKYPVTFILMSFFQRYHYILDYLNTLTDIFDVCNIPSLEYLELENEWWLRNMYCQYPPDGMYEYQWWLRTKNRQKLPSIIEIEKKINIPRSCEKILKLPN